MKKLLLLISVLVIAIAAIFFLPEKVEEIVVNELQDQGRRVFGTEVIVSDIDLNLKNGTALIEEISIANPANYSQTNAITLSSVFAKFDYGSGVIEEIIVSKPQVFAEFNNKNLNILDLANYAESARRNSIAVADNNQSDLTPAEPSSDSKTEKPQRLFTIKLAALEQASVSIKSIQSDEQKQFSIKRLEARDLQGNSHQLADQLVKQLFNDLSRQVIAKSALSLSEDALEKLKDKAKEKLKNLLN